ncbi:TonB-dependent receptor [Pseudomaricurvus alkylphenolicus]|uniref:TonB-dependent receptor n=1 Tax=Pseudomaricurvus alkylphenolicus TaxID=1306991 RepID=UPI0014203B50|nr:TonB-dependent receptor [Pseudomaricurvus alkylphenolicus]NIB40780.1 TonB-dependent receptor [Pseudomaricurvus alkylphenolicus]
MSKENKTVLSRAIRGVIAASLFTPLLPLQANVLEEVVVTAQKREQSMQDVGISVSAFSGDQMKALGVTNTVEITQQVPGLQVNSWSPTLTTFNLRGISQNNFTDNLEAPVAVYSDDVYVASMNAISGQLFDVERVEVLRGPQGTLFGRNATGGLIHYVSRDASEEELNGYIEGSYSDFNKRTVEGAVGGSLSETARFRLSARWEKADGYIESQDGPSPLYELTEGAIGNPGKAARDLQGADGYALRAAFQFDLSPVAQLDLTFKYTEDTDVATGGYIFLDTGGDPDTGLGTDIIGGSPLTGESDEHYNNTEGYFDREVFSGTAKLTWELENGIEFVSITNYTKMEKDYLEDGDGLGIPAIDFQNTVDPFTQWSQEIRFSGSGDNSRWQVGAYYLDMDLDLLQTVSGELFFGSATASREVSVDLEATNWSIFGQYEYDLTEDLTVIAGYRWSQDDKEIDFTNDFKDPADPGRVEPELFDFKQALIDDGLGADMAEIDYGDYALRLQLDYRLNEDTLVFASYNRGIKGGNWSPNQNVYAGQLELANIRHDEETLHSYELGIKTEFGDGLARFNATAFYYDYEDYQSFSFTGFTPSVANKDATAQGAEFELFLTPGDSWDFIFGLSVMDSDVEDVDTAIDGVTIDAELPSAPGYSFNFLGRKAWDLSVGELALQVDGVAYDEQYLEGHNSAASTEDSYSVWNSSLTFTTENWRLSGWVKNLTDEEYRVYNLDFGSGGSTAMYAPPRWYGVTAEYSF